MNQDTGRIFTWLTSHQGSTVKEIAAGTGIGSQYISARLKAAVMAGRARQDREHGAAPWRWSTLAPKRAVR